MCCALIKCPPAPPVGGKEKLAKIAASLTEALWLDQNDHVLVQSECSKEHIGASRLSTGTIEETYSTTLAKGIFKRIYLFHLPV